MTEKKENYYILNPFSNKGLEDSIEKIDVMDIKRENKKLMEMGEDSPFPSIPKVQEKETEIGEINDNDFNISSDETDGVKDMSGNMRVLSSGVIKEKTKEGLIYKINKKWTIENKLKVGGLVFLWLLIISLINIREVFAIKIVASGIIGYLLAKIWIIQQKTIIRIEDKNLKVGELSFPLSIIKTVALGRKKEIEVEKEISFALMSESLINESFNQTYPVNSLKEKDKYKLIITIEDNDYVIAKGLDSNQANDMLNELSN